MHHYIATCKKKGYRRYLPYNHNTHKCHLGSVQNNTHVDILSTHLIISFVPEQIGQVNLKIKHFLKQVLHCFHVAVTLCLNAEPEILYFFTPHVLLPCQNAAAALPITHLGVLC